MRRLPFLGSLLLIPVLAMMLATTSGCKKDKNGDEDDDPFDDDNGGAPVTAVEPLDAPKDGTVKGTVTFDGDPPMMQLIAATKEKDPEVCHDMADPFERKQQTWIVNDKKQVANVVVLLKPPEGKKFAFTKAEIDTWMKEGAVPKTVDLKQPHCAFIPHVVSLFTAYKEDGENIETGQVFVVHNDAMIKHNTKITGASTKHGNRSSDQSMTSGEKVELPINPQPNPLSVGCTIHPWMSAVIWSFDHPYHSVSDKDGSFAIQNVPTGVDIPVYVWHEDPNAVVSAEGVTFTEEKGFHRGTMKFQKGDNTLNLKISTK